MYECLASVCACDFPSFEVIVVDSDSCDKTLEIARQFPVRIINASRNVNASKARNIGVKKSKGEILVFTDSDCVVGKDWLKTLIDALGNADGVTGAYYTLNTKSSLARFVGYDMDFRHKRLPHKSKVLGTYNCAIRRNVFVDVGGFDERIKSIAWEDADLGIRLSEKYTLYFDNRIRVGHHHPQTLRTYFRKQALRAQGQVVMARQGHITDNYVGLASLLQLPTTVLFFLSPLFLLLDTTFALLIALLSLSVVLMLNVPLFSFISRRENLLFLFKSAFFIFLRNTSWLYGAVKGFTQIGESLADSMR